ncbi:MAG: HTH domain-containing protein [Paracoccaceae bacterium]|nr:HTH domain-containing protein [Paracoccaceae bacterium]
MYKIIQTLRDGQVQTAADLARRFDVTARTIYRDMERLIASGIDISSTPGRGYHCATVVNLPALNLTSQELEVLHLGLAVIGEGADQTMQDAALSLSQKIESVLPEENQTAPQPFGFALYPFEDAARGFQHMPSIRAAIRNRQKLELSVKCGKTHISHPLCLDYWGRVWNCLTWSETTRDFVEFRLDLIDSLVVLPELFIDEAGKTLDAYRKRYPVA